MSTQAQVNAAAATLTLANANAWRAITDPVARDANVAALMTTAGISPIDEYAVAEGRQALINLRPIAT